MHHFAINYNRFEVAKLVLKLAFLVLSPEKVDAILHQITLQKQSKLERSRNITPESQLTCLLSSCDWSPSEDLLLFFDCTLQHPP